MLREFKTAFFRVPKKRRRHILVRFIFTLAYLSEYLKGLGIQRIETSHQKLVWFDLITGADRKIHGKSMRKTAMVFQFPGSDENRESCCNRFGKARLAPNKLQEMVQFIILLATQVLISLPSISCTQSLSIWFPVPARCSAEAQQTSCLGGIGLKNVLSYIVRHWSR